MATPTTTDARAVLDQVTASTDPDRAARAALAAIAEPGTHPLTRLIATHTALGLLRIVVGVDPNPDTPGDDEDLHHLAHRAPAALPRTLNVLTDHTHRVLIPSDPHWPHGLNDLGPATPIALWATGDTTVLTASLDRIITITGTRAATAYGHRTATDLARDLARDGHHILTGGAFGIDAAATRAALTTDTPPIVILPCGIDRAHPTAHADLFHHVTRHGGVLLTEQPPGTRPHYTYLKHRARILAALAATTVIVEAATRSGTLTIAHRALALSRTVTAVPGPITSHTSTGCHHLIQHGETRLITDAADITTHTRLA